jgi:hypothetical protein
MVYHMQYRNGKSHYYSSLTALLEDHPSIGLNYHIVWRELNASSDIFRGDGFTITRGSVKTAGEVRKKRAQ